MSIKKVALEDRELWPDKVVCFRAWTDVRDSSKQQKIYYREDSTTAQAIAATVGVDLNTGEAIRKLLDKFSTELCNAGCVVKCETREERKRLIDAVKDKYAQAITATVGDKPKDNPRNYNPDGTPKIPNMHIGADPYWVDWVARLKHEEPLNLKEAVEQIMFETICFGGDMGPNDCGGEHCPDEGMVYTNDFINGWVNKIAATLGAGTCYPVPIYSFNGEFTEYDCDACSECGTEWDGDMPNFCPNCGRRVMEADE